MVIDSHTHAWKYWPYQPPVPDPESRGRVEQLLWEMDRAREIDPAAVDELLACVPRSCVSMRRARTRCSRSAPTASAPAPRC